MSIDKAGLRKFYTENMYGVWRQGEKVSYERLGEDPKAKEERGGFRNPFEVIGGELVKITYLRPKTGKHMQRAHRSSYACIL